MVCGGSAVAVAAMEQCELVCCDGACVAVCSVIKVSPALMDAELSGFRQVRKFLKMQRPTSTLLIGSKLYIIPGAR